MFKTQGFEARDLSESGLMLACADMHPAGCELTVELEIDNKRICLNAVIHWCRPSHLDNGRMYLLGLEFVSMQRPHQQLLRDYIAKMLARESLRAA